MSDRHERAISAFRADLKTMSLRAAICKNVLSGTPFIFDDDKYFELRRRVASEFKIHPTAVVVVGSSRLGFSLNPSHPYRLVESDSDVDLAIISQERFEDFWDQVFYYKRKDLSFQADSFQRMLFNGWIEPRGLPRTRSFTAATRWARFFDGLMQAREFGIGRISARLYRSWDRLEAYQEKSFKMRANEKSN